MQIEILKSKIHRATVTEANLHYVGSISIDADLMEAANLIACEKVTIANITNGERFDTYVIKGERGSGKIGVNGAAAHKVSVGDLLIIMAYARMDFEEAKTFTPSVVFPEAPSNRLVARR
ncbi:MAG: aspartate 1-decarboxylase [Prevotellaceae bacterium]|jgi:aspartate 1-decarboxylase|nr:aspartate 1-decarboxylase [Prevotellaceae bacterium]